MAILLTPVPSLHRAAKLAFNACSVPLAPRPSRRQTEIGNAMLSGKMMRHKIRVTVGDTVQIEMTPYEMISAGRLPNPCSAGLPQQL
jgi:hypothetical protein